MSQATPTSHVSFSKSSVGILEIAVSTEAVDNPSRFSTISRKLLGREPTALGNQPHAEQFAGTTIIEGSKTGSQNHNLASGSAPAGSYIGPCPRDPSPRGRTDHLRCHHTSWVATHVRSSY